MRVTPVLLTCLLLVAQASWAQGQIMLFEDPDLRTERAVQPVLDKSAILLSTDVMLTMRLPVKGCLAKDPAPPGQVRLVPSGMAGFSPANFSVDYDAASGCYTIDAAGPVTKVCNKVDHACEDAAPLFHFAPIYSQARNVHQWTVTLPPGQQSAVPQCVVERHSQQFCVPATQRLRQVSVSLSGDFDSFRVTPGLRPAAGGTGQCFTINARGTTQNGLKFDPFKSPLFWICRPAAQQVTIYTVADDLLSTPAANASAAKP